MNSATATMEVLLASFFQPLHAAQQSTRCTSGAKAPSVGHQPSATLTSEQINVHAT